MLTNQNTLPFAAWGQQFRELRLEFAPEHKALFYCMKPNGLPSFSTQLLGDIAKFQQQARTFIQRDQARGGDDAIRYLVHASDVPGIFNLGGDLARFAQLIRAQDRSRLMDYATACIEVLYNNHSNLDCDITTIALIEGTAAGGGFEAALSSDLIIAERGVELGFPEAIFNLFPGMGAYSFLVRRVSAVTAEQLIKSGRMYKAEELFDLGLVDELAEPGQARAALASLIRRHARYANMHRAMKKVKDRVHQVSHQELMDVTSIWVDSALQLPESNIRTMERLVKAQTHRMQRDQAIASQ